MNKMEASPKDQFTSEEVMATIGRIDMIRPGMLSALYSRIKDSDDQKSKYEFRFLMICQQLYFSYKNKLVRYIVSDLVHRFLTGIFADKKYASCKDYSFVLHFIMKFRNCKTITCFKKEAGDVSFMLRVRKQLKIHADFRNELFSEIE